MHSTKSVSRTIILLLICLFSLIACDEKTSTESAPPPVEKNTSAQTKSPIPEPSAAKPALANNEAIQALEISDNQVICLLEECKKSLTAFFLASELLEWSSLDKGAYRIERGLINHGYALVINLYHSNGRVYQIQMMISGDGIGDPSAAAHLIWMMNAAQDFTSTFFIDPNAKKATQDFLAKWITQAEGIAEETHQYGPIKMTLSNTEKNTEAGHANTVNITLETQAPVILPSSTALLSREQSEKLEVHEFNSEPYFGIYSPMSDQAIENAKTRKAKIHLIKEMAKDLAVKAKTYSEKSALLDQLIETLSKALPNGRAGLAEEIEKIKTISAKYKAEAKEAEVRAKEMKQSPDKFLGLFVKQPAPLKPVIYLYPSKPIEVKVRLDYQGEMLTYPAYPEGGWQVLAHPDGKLIDPKDQKEYSYLFWEGFPGHTQYDLSKGFVVPGKDTIAFLQEKLAFMGLTPKEYNEFIVFWWPKMQANPYNLITFQDKAYTDSAPLSITPKPDSILRVFMVFRPLDKPIAIPEQKLQPFVRKGFSVIEWGGSELK